MIRRLIPIAALLALPFLGLSCPKKQPGEPGQGVFPLNIVNETIKDILLNEGGISVWLNRGKSTVSLAGYTVEIFIADKEQKGCWPIEVCWRAYPHDINSTSWDAYVVDSPDTKVKLVLNFEESGDEIHGDLHGDMIGMALTLNLFLIAQNGNVSFSDRSYAFFSIKDIDLHGVPDTILTAIKDYRLSIENSVSGKVNQQLFSAAVSQRINAELNKKFKPLLALTGANNATIKNVAVRDHNLVIDYVAK